MLPGKIRIALESTGAGDAKSFWGFIYTVENVRKFTSDKPDIAEFKQIKVPNGTSAVIKGSEGEAWMFVNGDVQRFIDDESMDKIDGVRMRRPRPVWPYYTGLVAAAFFFWWLYFRNTRTRDGGNR